MRLPSRHMTLGRVPIDFNRDPGTRRIPAAMLKAIGQHSLPWIHHPLGYVFEMLYVSRGECGM